MHISNEFENSCFPFERQMGFSAFSGKHKTDALRKKCLALWQVKNERVKENGEVKEKNESKTKDRK